jgi:hypothetical protein
MNCATGDIHGDITNLTKPGTMELQSHRVLVVRMRTNLKDKIRDIILIIIIIIMDVTVIKYLDSDSIAKAYVVKLRNR